MGIAPTTRRADSRDVGPIQRTVVLLARSCVQSDSEAVQCLPVDGARKNLEIRLGQTPDDASRVGRCEEGVHQRDLGVSSIPGDLLRRHLLPLETLIDPRDEEEVPGSRMDYTCARKKEVGKRIADDADLQLVDGVAFAKELDTSSARRRWCAAKSSQEKEDMALEVAMRPKMEGAADNQWGWRATDVTRRGFDPAITTREEPPDLAPATTRALRPEPPSPSATTP